MSYAEDLFIKARKLYEKARVVDDMNAKKTYLIDAYHTAMGAKEHGESSASALMREIKSYAERNGIYFS